MKRLHAMLRNRSWLLAPLLVLAGCATPSAPSALVCPQIPSKPAARQPIPDYDYLERAKTDIETWQSELEAILMTP